jgi:hypothetical protein
MALRNAAKVALGTWVVGCGGSIVVGQEPDAAGDASKPKNDAAVDAALDVTVPEQDAALACTGETGVDASGVSDETFKCCVAEVQSATGDATPWDDPNGPDASLVQDNPAALNCCDVIVARIDDEPDGGSTSDDYSTASSALSWCCMALKSPMGPACTPWGPPAPPTMPIAMMEVA